MINDPAAAVDLIRRERDVLVALCRPATESGVFIEPASVAAIARELVVTEAAVKQHLGHLYDKFGISADEPRRRVALAREALWRNTVSLPELEPPRSGRRRPDQCGKSRVRPSGLGHRL